MLKAVHDEAEPNEASGSVLDEIVREAARQMLAVALQAEVSASIDAHAEEVDENRHRLVVRNGHHNEREVITAAGLVPSTHPTSSRWSVPARDSRTASSSNDPTDQRVVISKSRDTPIHRSRLYGCSAIR